MFKFSNKLKLIITVLLCFLFLSSCSKPEIKEGIVKSFITSNASAKYPCEFFIIQDDKYIIPENALARVGAMTSYYSTKEFREVSNNEQRLIENDEKQIQVDIVLTLHDAQIAVVSDYFTEPAPNEIWKYKDGKLTKKELPGGFHYIHCGIKDDDELFLLSYLTRDAESFTFQYTVVNIDTLEYEHFVNNIKISDCTDSKTIMSLWESGYSENDYIMLRPNLIQLKNDRLYLAVQASVNKTAKTWLIAFDAKTGNDPVMKFIEGKAAGIAVDGEEIFILNKADAYGKDETGIVHTMDLEFNNIDRYVFKTEGFKISNFPFVYYDGIMTFAVLSKNNNQLTYIYEYDVAQKELKRLEKPINGRIECINIHEYKDGIFYSVI